MSDLIFRLEAAQAEQRSHEEGDSVFALRYTSPLDKALRDLVQAVDTYLTADAEDYHTSSTHDMSEALAALSKILETK